MKPNLTHIALHVENIEACIAFYQRYCGLHIEHNRDDGDKRVVWLAEDGRETSFIMVLMDGGRYRALPEGDYSHLGFALDSRHAVDDIAQRAKAAGCLVWEPQDNPYPVGYYCGIRDPQGNVIEFSYGQPLGPGAEGHSASEI